MATLRRATAATLCPPEASVMWWDSLRITAVAGEPSIDFSDAVSSSMRPLQVSVLVSPGSRA